MSAGETSQSRVFKVTYEIVKDFSEKSSYDGSIEDLQEVESTFSRSPSKNKLKAACRRENKLWENLSFNSTFSLQVLQSDQPFHNCLKACNYYCQRHLKFTLFVFLAIFLLTILILALYFSFRDRIDINEEEEEEDSILRRLNLTDTDITNKTVCTHHLCQEKSKSLLSSLNKLVNPCENFSKFSCQNYMAYLPENSAPSLVTHDWTSLTRLSRAAYIHLGKMLEETSDIKKLNIPAVSKAAEFYAICRDNIAPESNYISHLEESSLEFLKLDWPLTNDSNDSNKKEVSLEYTLKEALMSGVNPFMKVEMHYHTPQKKNIISLDVGDLTFQGTVKQRKEKYKENKSLYVTELLKAVSMLKRRTKNYKWTHDMWMLEQKLFEITYNFSSDSPIQQNMTLLTLDELQKMYKNLFNFELLFSLIFERNVSTVENILIKNMYYFKNLPTVLTSTKARSKINFARWLFIMEISPFLPPKFSNYLSHVSNDANIGIENCLKTTVDVFPDPIDSLYAIKKNISRYDVEQIRDVYSSIVEALVDSLEAQTELKKKEEIVAEVKNLKFEIVMQPSEVDYDFLNKFYKSVVLKQSAVENYLLLKSKQKSFMFSALDKDINLQKIRALDSSIFRNDHEGTFQIPLALLQSPIYQSVYPTFLIYSALGSIIGHHLAHSPNYLDDLKFNQCLQNQHKQHGTFNIHNVGERFMLSELIADNIGLRSAYNANRKTVPDEKESLPDNKFNMEQLFFINYAQTWCRNKEPLNGMNLSPNYDFHQPSRDRVNNVLRNMPEFAKAFNCPLLVQKNQTCTLPFSSKHYS